MFRFYMTDSYTEMTSAERGIPFQCLLSPLPHELTIEVCPAFSSGSGAFCRSFTAIDESMPYGQVDSEFPFEVSRFTIHCFLGKAQCIYTKALH